VPEWERRGRECGGGEAEQVHRKGPHRDRDLPPKLGKGPVCPRIDIAADLRRFHSDSAGEDIIQPPNPQP